MRLFLTLTIFIILFTSCKTTKKTDLFYYEGEVGKLEYYNLHKSSKPLIVVLPDVYKSIITQEHLEALAKKNRIIVVRFLADDDFTRVQQIDGIYNRTTYYSSVLSTLLPQEKLTPLLIAEGVNATVALQLGLNFKQPELILLNAWRPSMREILTMNCYATESNTCDSLLNYLSFPDRNTPDKLLLALEQQSVDNQYGYLTLGVWKDFMDLNCEDLLINYKSRIRWIYTTNTGLSTLKSKEVEIISLKEFYKKVNLLSN